MSGIYITIGDNRVSRIESAAKRLITSDSEHTEIIIENDCAIAWVSHDPPELFAPAYHPATGVRIVTSGRVVWDESTWCEGEKISDSTGGLSNKILIKEYLEGGIHALENYDGSAAILIVDPRERLIHLITDRFGFYPVFLYRPQQVSNTVICTFPDAIATDSDVQTTPDYVSMAEFLREWKATPPHTYYNEIKYAGAATHCCWQLSQPSYRQREYWQAFTEAPSISFQTAVERLSEAVQAAIKKRTLPRLAPIVTYVSGGLDSRAILFAANNPAQVHGINLYDVPNNESAIAQQLCAAAQVEYIGYARDKDYYPRWIADGVKVSGAMWSVEDNHFMGTLELIQKLQAKTVLAAFPIDDVFKGACLEQKYVQLLGKNLPFFQLDDTPVKSFLMESPPRPPAPEFAQAMQERLNEWFGDLPPRFTSDLERLRLEDRRVRPACYQPGLSDNMMLRILPYDIFLGDRAIADCYNQIRPRWKINAAVWNQVIAKLCGNSIVDANRGWRPGASNVEKFLVYAGQWLQKRRKSKVKQVSLATDGSWSNLGWYALHSPTIKEMWESVTPEQQQIITSVWGSNPWEVPLSQWATPPTLTAQGLNHSNSPYGLFRILTLLNHQSLKRQYAPSSK
ncbi:hypothetical protein [Calothrix sp. 336/3]|uniref:hypothetical protein n=1 Tax=Calothrix sp. 336/3 TaxID=1337936 RepID=UPI0004E45E79|nr:hypothetical protein [Calothrix sp. 336/3]AKG22685.1 hypothetical protein IJ00_16655 [Calothrix sp. 336/3]